MTPDHEAELLIPCDYCKADPGVWCRTSSGGRATGLHSARVQPVRLGWTTGYLAGLADGRAAEVQEATRAQYLSPVGWQGPFVNAVANVVNVMLAGKGRGAGRMTARRLLAARILSDIDVG